MADTPKQIRWGIVGTGAMGALFANALSLVPGAVLQGVASRTRASADFAARFRALHAYGSYHDLLHDPAIDIVYIATRNEYHCEDSLAALNAGKPVLCEKPFALNAAEGRSVVEAARRRGVFCMEAMWMRCSPTVRAVLELVRSGEIGTPRLVTAQLGYPIPFEPRHRVFAPPGGGALYDFGVYPLSFVHALLGRPLRITSQACLGSTGVDDQFVATLEYASGCHAVIAGSLRAKLANAAAIHATDGILDRIGPLYFPDAYRLEKTNTTGAPRSAAQNRLPRLGRRVWSRLARGLRTRAPADNLIRHGVTNGYAFEAAAVQRWLGNGLLESPEMTLDDSIAVLECMDAIRGQWPEKS